VAGTATVTAEAKVETRYLVAAKKFLKVERVLHAAMKKEGTRTEEVIEECIESLAEIARTFREHSDPTLAAGVDVALGQAYLSRMKGERRANVENAIGHLESAIKAFDRAGDRVSWAAASDNLGSAYAARNPPEYDKAARQFEQALSVFDEYRLKKEHQATSRNLAIARQGGQGKGTGKLDVVVDADIADVLKQIIDPDPEILHALRDKPEFLELIDSARDRLGHVVIVDRTRSQAARPTKAILQLLATLLAIVLVCMFIYWYG
jgi:tetratricopeptide (TPR) repeat protein